MSSASADASHAATVLAGKYPAPVFNEYGSCTAPGYVAAPGRGGWARIHHQLPPVDLFAPQRPSSYERWLEMRSRVAEYAVALEADGWTVVRTEVLSGPILLATPRKRPQGGRKDSIANRDHALVQPEGATSPPPAASPTP
ncbi:hypothetical protein ACFYWP_39750 [Actinacidiphila glaucinigra]|uniref:hypothetical protein n=1 Tax=Actinacidiphila glaucinigra TaxID=235986 RepID=UPI003697A8C0